MTMRDFCRRYCRAFCVIFGCCLATPALAQDGGGTGPAPGQPPAVSTELIEVETRGEGITPDEAKNNALQKALEQAAGVEITSHSQTENFELIRDTIYARADGIVTDYRVLDEGDGVGGVKFCKIKARVRRGSVASAWGEVQNVLDQIGRPGIAVYITEYIDNQPQPDSFVASQIENKLVNIGFTVKSGEHIKVLAEKESAAAGEEGNIAKARALAKDFGAQIFIVGTGQADAAGVRDLYGEPTAMYNCSASFKMFNTDTGRLIASESLPAERGGARTYKENSPQAGKKAFENSGKKLTDMMYHNVMRVWATQISAGGEIELEISGVKTIDALKIKKALQDVPKVKSVNMQATGDVAKFTIVATLTAEQLAEYLIAAPFDQMFELVDIKNMRLQGKKTQ